MEQWHDLSSEPAQTILPKNQRRINRPIFIFGLLISKTKYWKIEKNHTKIEIWHFPFSISIRNRMNFIVMPSILIFMYKTTNSRKNVDFCKREPFFCNRYHIVHVARRRELYVAKFASKTMIFWTRPWAGSKTRTKIIVRLSFRSCRAEFAGTYIVPMAIPLRFWNKVQTKDQHPENLKIIPSGRFFASAFI